MLSIDEIFNTNINDLRNTLYSNYSRQEIADKLNLSVVQVSRLLNGNSIISYKQFLILKEMIKK